MFSVVERRAVEYRPPPECVPVDLAQHGGVSGIGPLCLDRGDDVVNDFPGTGSRQTVVGGCRDTDGELASSASVPADGHGLGRRVGRTHLRSQVERGCEFEGQPVPERCVVARVVVVVAGSDVEGDLLESVLWFGTTSRKPLTTASRSRGSPDRRARRRLWNSCWSSTHHPAAEGAQPGVVAAAAGPDRASSSAQPKPYAARLAAPQTGSGVTTPGSRRRWRLSDRLSQPSPWSARSSG